METLIADRLTQYSVALDTLAKAADPSPNVIVNLLLARDQVQAAGTQQLSADQVLRLIELDHRLRQLSAKITDGGSLAEWRASLTIDPQAWWWNLETPLHALDRFDWAWNALTLTTLTASAGLVVDISSKFLVATPGIFGSFALIGQSVLTLATAGGVLTEAGRRGIEQALASVGIQKFLWQETKLGLSLLLLLGMVGFRTALPEISTILTRNSLAAVEMGELAVARQDLERAVSLDAENAQAQYQLGQVYTQLGHSEQAREQYQVAVSAGWDSAYVALTNWYLKNEQIPEAAALINQGLSEIPETPETQVLRSHLYTQLGEVRYRQGRYEEAQASLETAIELANTAPPPTAGDVSGNTNDRQMSPSSIATSPAADPFCLLAKTLESQEQVQAALPLWNQCFNLSNDQIPQEDTWKALAAERLESGR